MLSRILFAEDNIDAEFWRFIKPWEATLDRVALAFAGGGDLGEEDIRVRRHDQHLSRKTEFQTDRTTPQIRFILFLNSSFFWECSRTCAGSQRASQTGDSITSFTSGSIPLIRLLFSGRLKSGHRTKSESRSFDSGSSLSLIRAVALLLTAAAQMGSCFSGRQGKRAY